MKKQEYAKANKEWLLEKTKEEGVREIPGGIYYKVLKEGLGDGRHPSRRSIVTAHYTGRTINGKKFDFLSWNEQQKSRFLDCCTGVKGVKVLYDAFFKEVMNPEYAPDRMEDFLSLVLKQRVKVMQVLPLDSTRIADESSLLIMDIVVELSDGSVANVEVQKIGYRFPGERCACYSADLLLRQYKRVREEWDRKTAEEVPVPRKFSYQCIKNVYTIILFEKSPEAFHEFQDVFFHHSEQKTDTGLKINLLQEYNFIALDIFRKNIYNKEIQNELEAQKIQQKYEELLRQSSQQTSINDKEGK